MKNRLSAVIAAICMLLCACGGSREAAIELSPQERDDLLVYAEAFARAFPDAFASPTDLDYAAVGDNSLCFIIDDLGYDSFECDGVGYPYVPRALLQEYVLTHFGIENYEYTVSENPNVLPQYEPEKDAYLFYDGRDGIYADITVTGEEISGDSASYTVHFEYLDYEPRKVRKTVNMLYDFLLLQTVDGYALQARSAAALNTQYAEIENLICPAMRLINDLTDEDPTANLSTIFPDVVVYRDETTMINDAPYAKTSLAYADADAYYGSVFTDEALRQVMSIRYADIDGVLYCSTSGGKTGSGFDFISLAETGENTYEGICRNASTGESSSIHFTVKAVGSEYRISDIDYIDRIRS